MSEQHVHICQPGWLSPSWVVITIHVEEFGLHISMVEVVWQRALAGHYRARRESLFLYIPRSWVMEFIFTPLLSFRCGKVFVNLQLLELFYCHTSVAPGRFSRWFDFLQWWSLSSGWCKTIGGWGLFWGWFYQISQGNPNWRTIGYKRLRVFIRCRFWCLTPTFEANIGSYHMQKKSPDSEFVWLVIRAWTFVSCNPVQFLRLHELQWKRHIF